MIEKQYNIFTVRELDEVLMNKFSDRVIHIDQNILKSIQIILDEYLDEQKKRVKNDNYFSQQ